jgi:O-antigen/teichoic acid export membrane protein
MFSFVAISSNYIFGTLLTANNNLKYLNLIAFAGLVCNILLNFILIPKLLAYGSAIASLSSQGLTAILQIILAYNLLKLKPDRKLIIGLLATVCSLLILGFAFRIMPVQSWLISLSIMMISGLSVAFIFKLLNISEFISILKEK